MTDDGSPTGPRVVVTAEFLAENAAKQAAYEAARRRHVARFRGGEDDVEAAGADGPGEVKRGRRRIEDKRQLRLGF
jgi:hypothetical protein